MIYKELDTPCLIIDKDVMLSNLNNMQRYANINKVNLRPHTKTHKMSRLALLQESIGAKGITVAKVGEAEVMASKGLKDIFIANEIVGELKLNRIKKLADNTKISFGIDSIEQVNMIEKVFADCDKQAEVLIEIEVGENRSGVISELYFLELLNHINICNNIYLKGIFSHDGNSYSASSIEQCKQIHLNSQKRTLNFANIATQFGFNLQTISIGSTPSLMFNFPILKGITEIRPGTYIFMDAAQANALKTTNHCAASVLVTVISLPTNERIIADAGAKALTTQTRSTGITKTAGLGIIKGYKDITVNKVFDEHTIIYSKEMRSKLKVGDKLEIIPNHICPVVNLHENAYLVSNSVVVEKITVDCRGKLK